MRSFPLLFLLLIVPGCGSDFSTGSANAHGGTTSTEAIVSNSGGSESTTTSSAGRGNVTGAGMGGAEVVTSTTSLGDPTHGGAAGNPAADARGGSTPIAGSAGMPQSICGPLRSDRATATMELCIPTGTFVMGSMSANLGSGHADHTPSHPVTLSTFVIDAFEVTNARYRACVVAGGCTLPSVDTTRGCSYAELTGNTDNLPVSCVTALQAEQFCTWDGNRRLPSEAEWERTARGTDERVFPWGPQFTCGHANVAANATCASVHRGIEPVGSNPNGASPEGAHDMAGNVAEWVKDFAASYPTTNVTNPTGPAVGVSRILRGGSFGSNSPDARTFIRLTATATTVGAYGFRCARSVE